MPEVYFVFVTLVKVAILLPNYFVYEINTLFLVLVLNSLCSYFLTYILSQRTCVTLELPLKKVWWNKFFFLIQVILFVVITFVSPLFDFDGTKSYKFLLQCETGFVYRKYQLFYTR